MKNIYNKLIITSDGKIVRKPRFDLARISRALAKLMPKLQEKLNNSKDVENEVKEDI
jgi:hypothetical protein